MASNTDLPTDMGFQNATLPKSGNSTPERLSGPTPLGNQGRHPSLHPDCLRLRKYDLLSKTLKCPGRT
ncbi:hypothetical protein TNCV_1849561 [Trichonephila clavipes]|nr:hypothetical protein TNCV_1849561 [Trichonephila clavipes]